MDKTYTIRRNNGEVTAVEVDGVLYEDLDQIPDPEDRATIERMINASDDEDFSQAFAEEFEREFRELERQTASAPRMIVAILATVAAIMAGIALISSLNTARSLAREQSAPGVVVDLAQQADQAGKRFYYPVIEYRLPDESSQMVQLPQGSTTPEYAVGEAVTVMYEVQHPLRARIQSPESTIMKWLVPLITGVLALAFLAATLFAIWFLRPNLK